MIVTTDAPAHEPQPGDLYEHVTTSCSFRVVSRLDNGRFILRGVVSGRPHEVTAAAFTHMRFVPSGSNKWTVVNELFPDRTEA